MATRDDGPLALMFGLLAEHKRADAVALFDGLEEGEKQTTLMAWYRILVWYRSERSKQRHLNEMQVESLRQMVVGKPSAAFEEPIPLSQFHPLPRSGRRGVAYAGSYVVTVPYPPGPGITGSPRPTFEEAFANALAARETADSRREGA